MSKRIVIKIGSRLLTSESGKLSVDQLNSYVRAVSSLHQDGHEIILVSSGSIAAGFEKLGYSSRPSRTKDRQACAAVGQGLLIEAYTRAFASHDITAAQILLTRRDFTQRDAYNNALSTIELLLEKKVVPVINENDSIAVEELNYGDNDILAALLSGLLQADHLFLLTDTPGLFSADPTRDSNAKHIACVEAITPEIEALGGESSSGLGSGGMRSKLRAAKRALSLGVKVFIGTLDRSGDNAGQAILSGAGKGTHFGSPELGGLKRKKQWLAFHAEALGTIHIDNGAMSALVEDGRSLLPAGVISCTGTFQSGDVIEVRNEAGKVLGKGTSRYTSDEILRSRGKSTSDVKTLLGDEYSVLIHRDDWVCLYGLLKPGGDNG
jgi:glutamate 5-kinase